MSLRDQIRKGSTEILILRMLADAPMYGYQMVQELNRRSNGYFELKEGLLYPTLHRMKKQGLLTSEWRDEEDARRRKYYQLTDEGRALLDDGSAEWREFIEQMQAVLGKWATE